MTRTQSRRFKMAKISRSNETLPFEKAKQSVSLSLCEGGRRQRTVNKVQFMNTVES